jgi:hypothetical protein
MVTKKTTTKAADAAVPSDSKLKALQTRINKDTKLRNAFIKDPGSVLRKEGIELGADKEADLAKYMRQVTAQPAEIFGAQFVRVQVGIRVRIRVIVNIGVTI